MNNLTPIHLIDNNVKTLVYINPLKNYGNLSGKELIESFADKTRKKPKPKPIKPIHWERDKYHNLTTNQDKTIGKASIQEMLSLKFVPHAPQETFNLHLTQHHYQKQLR